MPVRIIFRGLMLFQIPEAGPNAGKLVAYVVNHPTFAGGSKAPGHVHDHKTLVQILTGAEKGPDLVAKEIARNATLNITVPGPKGVFPSSSLNQHIPRLSDVIAKATPAIKNAARGGLDRTFIQNVVTVDRGIVRAKDVSTWDQGGYPLSGNADEIGVRAPSAAIVKFMGSSLHGHMATEVAVEISDADEVQLASDHDSRFNGPKQGSAGTVEILISSYESPGAKPTPWGLDFQWLFEAAGYGSADLAGPEFTAWVGAGRAYDANLFDAERTQFFGAQGTIGRPFPYIESAAALMPLQPLTNWPNIFACYGGLLDAADTVTFARTTDKTGAVTESVTIKMKQAAVKKAPVKKAAVKKAAVKKSGAKKTAAKKTVTKKKRGR